ncbi:MAG: hypothetical protein H7249_07165 [Chitinophagaceae bacterium]|nr:hypothetical protein [Oligoflexus sp.]
MNEALGLSLSMALGFLLGIFFFGGLWWTIQIVMGGRRSAIWFLGSYLLRTTFALGGFYLIGSGQWQQLVSSMVGFLAARFAMKSLVFNYWPSLFMIRENSDATQSG